MKCSREDQHVLLELANAHLELESLEAQAVNLPEKQRLDDAVHASALVHSSEVSTRVTTAELDAELFRLDSDIAKLRRREADDQQALGASTDREHRRDLTHDMTAARRRRNELEAQREEIEAKRDAYIKENRIEKEDSIQAGDSVAAARRAVNDAMSSIARRIEETEREISILCDKVSPEILDLYEKQREEHGVGAAILRGRVCQGCYMTLDNATIAEFNAASPDALLRCPDCGTILIREEN